MPAAEAFFLEKSLSADTTQRDTGVAPKGVSALKWAATEDGRAAFSSQFKIHKTRVARRLTDSEGRLLSQALKLLPSRLWMQERAEKLFAILSDKASYTPPQPDIRAANIAQLRGLQAEYLSWLSPRIAVGAGGDGTLSNADRVLTKYYEELQNFQWTHIVNRIITLAAEQGSWLLKDYTKGGETRLQAMPRKFARTREDIPRHDHSTPNKFQPDRIFQLTLPLDGFSDISTRQLRCMNGFKKADSTDEAVLSVMALELKAHGMDLPIAKAQCMYSAVQGAALSQNANLDMPTLLLSVASGFVHPQVSCWPGKLRNSPPDNSDLAELHAADVCIVDGDSFDLGTMASVVSLFLTVYDTLDMVLRRAYPAADNYDDLETRTITSPADPAVRRRILTPNSLVEWRSRVLPRFQKPSSKRKSEGAESARVKKKSKSDDAEKDEDEADNEDFHGSDTEL